jgi:hypothetical protein
LSDGPLRKRALRCSARKGSCSRWLLQCSRGSAISSPVSCSINRGGFGSLA